MSSRPLARPPRSRAPELSCVASPDENQGVRSVGLTHHILSFGTGRGKLFLYDLRAEAFLPAGEPRLFSSRSDACFRAPPRRSRLCPTQGVWPGAA